jgi:hypothetical protein
MFFDWNDQRRLRHQGLYVIKVGDGTIGRICDFMMDGRDWAIR